MGYFGLHPCAYHRVCVRTFRTFSIYLVNFLQRHAPRLEPGTATADHEHVPVMHSQPLWLWSETIETRPGCGVCLVVEWLRAFRLRR